jgi:hypothetical protein
MSLSINGTNGLVFNDGSTQNTAAKVGMVNRIINGAMMIDQRNAGASVTPTTGAVYELDRWHSYRNSSGAFSVQQVSDAPSGFTKSAKITVSTAYAGSSEQYNYAQFIEGNNIFDLSFGSSAAKTITLSFWIKSSVTGTFSGGITSYSADVSYPFTYSITVANTWEYKTVTITGATTGTWSTDNTAAMRVIFDLGSQTSNEGTANTWNSGYYYRVAGSVRLIATNTATWQITGVQLEKGSTATSFDYRPYGTELALCQRYYQVGDIHLFSGNTSSGDGTVSLPVQMRANPSYTYTDSSGTANTYTDSGGSGQTLSINANSVNTYRFRAQVILARNATWWEFNFKLSAEL